MIYTAIDLITLVFEIIVTYMFFDAVLDSRRGGALARAAVGAAYCVLTWLYNIYIESFVLSFVIMLLLTFMCTAVYKDSALKKLLMSLLYMLFIAVSNFVFILAGLTFGISIEEMVRDKSIYNIMGLVIVMILMTIMVKAAGLFFYRSRAKVSASYWILLLSIPVVNIIFILHYTRYLYSLNAEFSYSLVILTVSAMYSTLLVFYLFDKLTALLSERDALSEQVGGQRRRDVEIDKKEEHIMSVRHDIVNHMRVIQSLIRRGDPDAADRYIDELGLDFEGADELIDTGNTAIDILVSGKKSAARRLGIVFREKMIIPENLKISNVDAVILLGNLLDNAIEGCERADAAEKHIDLTLKYRNSYLLCVVENTSDPVKIGRGFLKTSKQDADSHGIGLRNIKRIVNKYNGESVQKYENGVFISEILIFID